MYKWNILNNAFLPTDYQLKQALKSADAEVRPDARNLMSLLMRVASIERVKGQINTLRTAITAFDWKISEFDKSDRDKADEARLRCRQTINYLLKYRVQAQMFGAFAVKLNWSLDSSNKWKAKSEKRYKPVELLKIADSLIQIANDNNDIQSEFDVYDYEQSDYIGEVDESDEYGGALRSIAKKHLMVWDTLVEWMNYNKKLKGIIQAVAAGAPDDEELAKIKAALMNVVTNNFTLTDDQVTFNFENITQAGAFASYIQFIQQVNIDTSIAILGQANSSELPSSYGSNGALKVLSKVSADIHYSNMQSAEELINRFLLLDFRKNVAKDAEEVPWNFAIQIPEEYTIMDRSDFVRNLKDSGIKTKASEVYNFLGLEKPDDAPEYLFDLAI